MTREEAIDVLTRHKAVFTYGDVIEAIDMAISALSATNDAIKTDDEVIEHDREWIIGCIKHDGFIKTDRFDKANQIILEALEPTEPSDLISRYEALQAINGACEMWEDEAIVADILHHLPSVSAERVVRCKDCEYAEHRKQMPNQVYCHRDTLSLSCSVHDDDDYCKWAKMKGGAE